MRPFPERSRSQGRRSATAGPGGLGVGRAGGPPASTRLTAGEVARQARERGDPWIVPDPQHHRPYHPRPPHPRPSEAGAMPVLPRPESRPVASSRSSAGPRVKPVSSALRFARLGWAVLSVMTLTISGAAWHELGRIADGFSRSNALAGAAHSAGGAENILLVGLDTRKDQNGDDLPPDILRALHAGDGQEGGYNTNSIILVHIPADRKNIVAFSIPRDDLVAMTGVDVPEAKIKEAYGRRKAIVEQQLSAHSDARAHAEQVTRVRRRHQTRRAHLGDPPRCGAVVGLGSPRLVAGHAVGLRTAHLLPYAAGPSICDGRWAGRESHRSGRGAHPGAAGFRRAGHGPLFGGRIGFRGGHLHRVGRGHRQCGREFRQHHGFRGAGPGFGCRRDRIGLGAVRELTWARPL